jgi:hypothetical protein
MRIMYCLIFSFFMNIINASVSVIDQSILSQETNAIQSYVTKINNALDLISSTLDTKKQIDSIRQIIDNEENIINTCINKCTNQSLLDIRDNIDKFNQQITNNFNNHINGIKNKISSIKSIENLLMSSNNNTKEAGLALQKATQKEILALNDTMENIQNILLINQQQSIQIQKIEQKNNQDFYSGFKNIGL